MRDVLQDFVEWLEKKNEALRYFLPEVTAKETQDRFESTLQRIGTVLDIIKLRIDFLTKQTACLQQEAQQCQAEEEFEVVQEIV